jgi:hypothetical protein
MRAPPVISSRPFPYVWLLLPAAPLAAIGVLVLFRFNPTQYAFYPRCTLYVMTGIFCPGCGCLRALHELTHGHVLAALHDNLLLVLGIPLLAVDFWQYFYRRVTGHFSQLWVTRPVVFKSVIAVIVLFTILRNIHAAPFTWLAPP